MPKKKSPAEILFPKGTKVRKKFEAWLEKNKYADLSNATSATINEMREAMVLQAKNEQEKK